VTQEARTQLTGFLDELKQLIDEIPKHPDWTPYQLKEALEEARKSLDHDFERARQGLAQAGAATLDRQLSDAGLTKPQLDLKLSGFGRAVRRFRDAGGKVLFRRALRWANVILGSLAGIVPGVEAIKEYKESIEAATEDTEPDQ